MLYIDYQMFGKEDIIEAFEALGCMVNVTDVPIRYGEFSTETIIELGQILDKAEYDIVFSSNYYPYVSQICSHAKIKYLSWTYDSPRIALYDESINNSCNYAFVFDSEECLRLRTAGVNRVFYMPLGVNCNRIEKITISPEEKNIYSADISLVASLYNEKHNLYNSLYEKLDDYSKGYLDAVVRAQSNIFGGSFLEDSLKDEIISVMYKVMPYDSDNNSYTDLKYVYANYFLARKVATYQRKGFIREISKRFNMKVYTPGDISDIPDAIHMGTVDYSSDMNKVFKLSKINLNITLPSIKTGIPLRALDIMGAGGFLLTDYRNDFEGIFEPGIDMVCYSSVDEALSQIDYYLEHEDERMEIAENGMNKIKQYFSYIDRIGDMLELVMN